MPPMRAAALGRPLVVITDKAPTACSQQLVVAQKMPQPSEKAGAARCARVRIARSVMMCSSMRAPFSFRLRVLRGPATAPWPGSTVTP